MQIVRDQCWTNETLKTVNWVAEDLMPAREDERDDVDATGAPEKELEALLKGKFRIPHYFHVLHLTCLFPQLRSGNTTIFAAS